MGEIKMNFIEAVQAMKKGKKVRLKGWCSEGYVVIEEGEFVYKDCNCDQNVCVSHVERTDWEIVEEKKTLSDKVILGNSPSDARYNELDVKESLLKIMVWVTTEHAPNKSSQVVLDKVKEICGDRLV